MWTNSIVLSLPDELQKKIDQIPPPHLKAVVALPYENERSTLQLYVLDRQPVRNIPANNARGTKSRVRPAEYNRRQLRLETRSSC